MQPKVPPFGQLSEAALSALPDAARGRPAGEGMASYAEGLRRMTDKELRAEEKRLEDAINNRDQHDYFDVSAKYLELSREQENRKSGIYLTQQQYFDRWLKDRIAAKDRAEFLSDAGRVAGIREQTDSNHRAAVEWALSRGRFVPANVLAEYPDLSAPAAQAKPAEVATPEATEKAPAEPPKAATGEQTVTSPPLRIPSHQPSDSGAVDKSASEPIPKQKSKPSPLRKGDHVLFKGEEYYISAFPRLLRRQGRVEITLVGGEKTATPLLKDLIPAGERAAQPQKTLAAEKAAAEPVVEQTLTDTVVSVPLSKRAEASITMKEQKAFLLAEIDKAIESAPPSAAEGTGLPDTVRIEVPNDGTFTILNGRKELEYAKRLFRSRFPSQVPKYVAPKITVGKEDLGRDADHALDLYKDAETAARKVRQQMETQAKNGTLDDKQRGRMEALAHELEARAYKTSTPKDQRTAMQQSLDRQIELGTYPPAQSRAVRDIQAREKAAVAAMRKHPLYGKLRAELEKWRPFSSKSRVKGDVLNINIFATDRNGARAARAVRDMQNQIASDLGLHRMDGKKDEEFDLRLFYQDFAKEFEPAKQGEAAPEKIEDFGEKIGGARKDTAERGYTMTKNRDDKADAVPTWRKKYVILKKVDGSGWSIAKKDDKLGNIMVGNRGQTFATEAEAEAAIPLVAVAQNYVARQNKGKKWEIYKRVGKRKLLKVVNREFDSREEATKHMALNAVDLLNLKTSFGEEILPAPDVVRRVGPERRKGNVTPEMFMETFAPRGIEFGNWNNQEERQAVMNHAYDALLDLAEVLDVPPKALMLDGDLAIAFGARGHGLSGAKAHYELDYGVINLTKMSGAGSLAHEWMHALDHYLARLDSKAPSGREKNKRGDMVYPARSNKYTFQSRGYSFRSKMREELKKAYQDLIESLMRKAEKYVEDTTVADKFLWKAKEELRNALNNVRTALASDLTPRHKSRGGWSGKPIKHLRPASAEQLAEFDRLADILVEGGSLESKFYPNESAKKGLSGRQSNETLEAISGILKAARGRSGFLGNRNGPLDRVRYAMSVYSQRIKTLDSAKTGEQKKRTVATNYAIEARKMDQTRVGDYWSEPHEMVARAFAAYVEDKVAEKGGASEFLVYHAHGGILLPMIDGFVARPYPEGKEREAINAMFDNFVKTIKTKETERGVAMFAARNADIFSHKMDADYFSAIERGDVEAVERIAEDAAKAAGAMLDVRDEYDEFGPVKVYTGSKNKGFTTFDKSRLGENSDTADATIGFFFTKNKGIAKKHFAGPDGEVRSFYIIGDKDLDVASVSMEEYESMLFGSQDEREKAGYDYRDYKDGEKAKANFEKFLREQVQDKEIIRVEDPEFAPENPEFESGMFIVRNPSLIKSADPIVRDADGNIIPLSARFNPKVNDIRFAARNADIFSHKMDADYFSAVKRGDMETAERMVLEAAREAGYTIGPVYHGSERPSYPNDYNRARDEVARIAGIPDAPTIVDRGFTWDAYEQRRDAIDLYIQEHRAELPGDLVYRASNLYRDITVFDKRRTGSFTGAEDAKAGFFFTPDRAFAERFTYDVEVNAIGGRVISEKIIGRNNPHIYTTHLRMNKPIRLAGMTLAMARQYVDDGLFPGMTAREVYNDARSTEGSKELQQYVASRKDKAVAAGYDGIINWVTWRGKRNQEIVVFEPSQIKSADAVTYDADGNIIPLSARFNPKVNDIRFAARNADIFSHKMDADYFSAIERGDMETAQKMVDEAARGAGYDTLPLYHGTVNEFTVFDLEKAGQRDAGDWGKGFYFTPERMWADSYAAQMPNSRVMSVYLRLRKPFVINLPEGASHRHKITAAETGIYTILDSVGFDYTTVTRQGKRVPTFGTSKGGEGWSGNTKETIPLFDLIRRIGAEDFREALIKAGYDGVINTDTQERVAFYPDQIKSADAVTYDDAGNVIPLSARFNPKVNDIRFAAKQDATPAPTVPDSWKPVEGDIVVGDTIRFSEAVFSGQHYNPKYEGNREVIAEVLKISAGDIQSENTISLRVVSSSGEQPIAEGTKTRRKRKNVFRNEVSRLTWENEQHRGELASTGDEATDYLREYLAGKTRFQAYVLDIFDRLGVEYSPRMRFGFPSYDYVYTDYGEIRIKDHKQPLGGGMNEGTREHYGESAIDIFTQNGKINVVFNDGKDTITEWLDDTEAPGTRAKFQSLFDALSQLDGKSSSVVSAFIEKKVRELETTRSTARTPEDVLIFQKGLEQGEAEGVKGGHEQRAGERWGDFASGEPGRIGGEHDLSDGSQREIAAGQAESIWGTGKGRVDAERIVEKARQRDWGRKVVVDDSPEILEVMSSIRARAAALGANVVKARRDSIGTDGVYLGGGDILIATRNTASEINEATDHELIHFLDAKGDKDIRGLRRKINRTSRAWKGLRKWLRTNYRLNLLDSGMREPEVQSWLAQNLTPEDVDKELVAELARSTTGPSEINLWEAFGPLQKQAERDFAKLNERLYAGAAAQEGAVDSTTTADSGILAARPAWEGRAARRIREMVERGEYPDLRAEPYTMRSGKAAHKVVDQDGRAVRYGLTQAEANEFIIRRGAEIADMVGALAGQNPEHLEKSMKAYREMERLLSSTTVPRTEAVRRIISNMKDMGMLKYVDAKSIAPIMRQIAKTETPLGVDKALYRADLFIRGRLAEAAGKKVMRDLNKLIETKLPKLQDNKTLTVKPKHLMYVAKWFKRAKEYMQMTPEEKNAAIEAIEAKLAMDMANTGEDMSEETADAVVDKMLLYTFGGLGESPGFNRAMAAYNAAKTLVDFGVDKYMAEENRKKAEAEAYRNKAIEETKAGREFDLNEDEFLRRDTPFKEWLTRLANHIHAKALGGRYLFDQAFDSRKGVEPMSGVMVGMYRRKNKAVADKYLLDEALMARLNDELLNVVGANPENSVEEAKRFHETWTDWKKQQENSGVFFRKIIYDDDGNIIRLEKTSEMRASKLEMLYYWLIAKRAQELAKQNFTNTPRGVKGGFNWLMLAMVKNRYTAETVAEMDKALPVGLKQLGRWMVDQIIESRPLVEKSTMALLGATPEMEGDWYFPVNKQNDRKGIATGGNAYTMVQSFMKALTKNTLDLRPSDPIQVFLNYFGSLHHVATHVELVDMANRVIRHPDMQKTLRRYKGEAIQKAVNNDLDRLTIGGEGAVMSSLIERFQKGFARSVVPSIGQMPRQFTSSLLLTLPRFHPPGTSFASNVVKAVKMMLNPSALAQFDQELNEDVPRWRERYQRGYSQHVRTAREKHGFNLNRKLSWFEALNFFPQAGDKLASLTGRPIYDNWYNYYLSEKKMSPEDAQRAAGEKFMQAVNESQQSGALPDLGDSQVGWAKWFMMFKSQDVALTRMWMEAARNIAMRRGSVKDNVLTMLAVSVSQMFFQAVVDGFFIAAFDDPDARKRFRNNQIRAALLAPINGYILFPEAIERLVTVLMGDKIYGDFAGDVVPWVSVVDSTIEIGEQLASDSQLTAENWWTIAQRAADVTGALARQPVGPTVRLAKGMSDAITEDMPAAGRPLRFLGWSKQAAGQKRKKKPRRSGASKKPWDDDPW